MTTNTPQPKGLPILVGLLLAIAGCGSSGSYSDPFLQEAARRQAQQSQAVADASKNMSQASRALIEGEATARRDVIALQRELRADQAEIATQRDGLEQERQSLDKRRHELTVAEQRESIVAPLLAQGGLMAACLTPLLLAAAAVLGFWRDVGDQAAAELIAAEFESGTVRLPRPAPLPQIDGPANSDDSVPGLPAPS